MERSSRDFTGGKEWVQQGTKILSGKAKSKVILFRSIKLFSLSFLLPRLPLQNFGKCDKFTSFAQCNKRCKRNMQIEIPSKVREEGQYLFSTPPNYYTFIIWYQQEPITPIVKHSFSPTSLFNIWNFLFRQIKFR